MTPVERLQALLLGVGNAAPHVDAAGEVRTNPRVALDAAIDERLRLNRSNGGAAVMRIHGHGPEAFVAIERVDADGAVMSAVKIKPEELDRLVEAGRRCRSILLGSAPEIDPCLRGART